MKKSSFFACAAVLLSIGLFMGCSSVPSKYKDLPSVQSIPLYEESKAVKAEVSRGTGEPILGLGVEFDPHFIAQNTTRNDGATASDWEHFIVPRVKAMEIQRFRVMLLRRNRNQSNDSNNDNNRQ